MLRLTINNPAENIIVTLKEKQTLTAPYFLFIFTNVSTKDEVTKIFAPAAELSAYPLRYNKFQIATSTVFNGKQPGFWIYKAYEQASAVNTDPDAATTLLETGILELLPATTFAFENYNEAQTFKQYAG